MKKQILLVISVLLLMLVSNAKATVIDFETLRTQGIGINTYFGSSYDEKGYKLTTTSEFAYTELYAPGSIVLYSGPGNGTVELSQENGETFDLISIDFASGIDQTVTMIGAKRDGSIVNQAFLLEHGWLISSYSLNGFTDVISVSWESNTDPLFNTNPVFDNITVIPEPTIFSLLVFGGVILARVKR